jgi:hypothetical protein
MLQQQTKRTNLLIIRGVRLADLIALTTTQTSITHTARPPAAAAPTITVTTPASALPTIAYPSLPKRFTGVSTWPTETSLLCWNCDGSVPGVPAFIPLNPEKTSAGDDYCDPIAPFCSWNCAASYAAEKLPRPLQWDAMQTLPVFESKWTGVRRLKIPPAPAKTLMRQYCGDQGLTRAQWNAERARIDRDYTLMQYKLEHFCISDTPI